MHPTDLQLPRIVAAIAALMTGLLALALPIGYFSVAREALVSELVTKTEIKAETINQLISTAPELWRFQEHRLRELLKRYPVEHPDEKASIIDSTGALVAESDNLVQGPFITRSAALSDAGTTIGRVEIRRSLRPTIVRTLVAAALGAVLGLAVFVLLRSVPARARRVVEAMFEEKERAQVTLRSIGDAVITTDRDQAIEFLNPVAEDLTGWSLAEARGRPLAEVMQLIDEATKQPTPTPMAQALRENRIAALSTEVALRRRDGTMLAIQDSAAPVHDRQGKVIGGVMVFHDVTIARNMVQRISWAATHDALTGLVNRHEFERRVEAALANASNSGTRHALMYMDLDQFKVINDTCGHAAGDSLLQQLSVQLQAKLRQSDTLARLGGDEFGVLLDGCPIERAELIAADLLATVRDYRLHSNGRLFSVGVSIGLVAITELSDSSARVFGAADSACYAAKEQGRNRVCVHHASDEDIAQQRQEVTCAARLRQALELDRFILHYQTYLALGKAGTDAHHIEILLRMIDDDGRLVMPGSFIAMAERYNLMPAIDRWVIKTVAARYHDLGEQLGSPLTCAINLSGTTLAADDLLDFIRHQALVHGLPPRAICFEIAEAAAINNLRRTAQVMRDIKELGFLVALDAIGAGTSSFEQLRNLPVDYLKIGGALVRGITTDALHRTAVENIHRLGRVLGLKTVGEFADTDSVIGQLQELGVDFAQGYGVHMPQPLPQSLTTRSATQSPAVHST